MFIAASVIACSFRKSRLVETAVSRVWYMRPNVTGNLTNDLVRLPVFGNAKLVQFFQKVQNFPGITADDHRMRIPTVEPSGIHPTDSVDFRRSRPPNIRAPSQIGCAAL